MPERKGRSKSSEMFNIYGVKTFFFITKVNDTTREDPAHEL